MSSTFWKIGGNLDSETSLSRLLRNGFIRISEGKKTPDQYRAGRPARYELPNNEEDTKNFRPNMEILDGLLDDDDLYSEIICANTRLLLYFQYRDVLEKLVDYITTEPAPQGVTVEESTDEVQTEASESVVDETNESAGEDKIRARRHLSAEILSADAWPISHSLLLQPDILDKFWRNILIREDINGNPSTYFVKVNEHLLDSDPEGMLAFLKSRGTLVDEFFAHIDNPPLMDFLLKVLCTDRPDEPNGIIELLRQQGFVPKLIDLLGPEYPVNIQSSTTDFIKALITISGNCIDEITTGIGPNELTRQLASEEMMEKLVSLMLQGGHPLSNGVEIIVELIRKNNSDYDFVQVMDTTLETHPPTCRDPIYLGYMLDIFSKNISKFNSILTDTTTELRRTSFGQAEPLGLERFRVCELIAELLHCSNMGLLNEKDGEKVIRKRDEVRKQLLEAGYFYDKLELLTQKAHEDAEATKVPPVFEESDSDEEVKVSEEVFEDDVAEQWGPQDLEETAFEEEQGVGEEALEEPQNEEEPVEPEIIDDTLERDKKVREAYIMGDRLKIALYDTQILHTMLEMFFHFSWNSFLHNVIFDVVQQIFNGPLKAGYNLFLIKDLLTRGEVTKMIIDGNNENTKQEQEKNLRMGYMGHLILVSEEIIKLGMYIEDMQISFVEPDITDALTEDNWRVFVDDVVVVARDEFDKMLGEPVHESVVDYNTVVKGGIDEISGLDFGSSGTTEVEAKDEAELGTGRRFGEAGNTPNAEFAPTYEYSESSPVSSLTSPIQGHEYDLDELESELSDDDSTFHPVHGLGCGFKSIRQKRQEEAAVKEVEDYMSSQANNQDTKKIEDSLDAFHFGRISNRSETTFSPVTNGEIEDLEGEFQLETEELNDVAEWGEDSATKNDTSMNSNISFKSLSRSSSRDYHPIITGNSDDESFSDEEEEENSDPIKSLDVD